MGGSNNINHTNAFWKVLKTIETAQYIHLVNGSVMNLINNFNNMYKCKHHSDVLDLSYKEKLKEFKV